MIVLTGRKRGKKTSGVQEHPGLIQRKWFTANTGEIGGKRKGKRGEGIFNLMGKNLEYFPGKAP